jgi:uncharacterized protein with HEPN domain
MMVAIKPIEEWKEILQPVLQSKLEEFHIMGYESVTKDEIWKFIEVKLTKKQQEWMLHELVNSIFRLRVNDFMNWLTIEAFQSDSMFS